MPTLEAEVRTYNRLRDGLLVDAVGKFAVVSADRFLGAYDTYERALAVGYDKCGLAPFLVRQVRRNDEVEFSSHDVLGCRAA